MSGETEVEDYNDFKIELEQQKDLDCDIQDIIHDTDETISEVVSAKDSAKKTVEKDKIKDEIKYPPKCVHYRTADMLTVRSQEIVNKNKVIRHRNKLVRQARENGKFYLEGGVLSMQQSQMFKFDQEVLKTELKSLCDKNLKIQSGSFKTTETTLQAMITKLDQIQTLNDQSKKND